MKGNVASHGSWVSWDHPFPDQTTSHGCLYLQHLSCDVKALCCGGVVQANTPEKNVVTKNTVATEKQKRARHGGETQTHLILYTTLGIQ